MQPKLRKNRLGKTWGFAQAKLDPTSLSALKLKYCLEALETVHGKVLEVGCGAGMFTIAIKKAKRELQVYGSDIDEKSIKLAKKRTDGVNFRWADIYKLPFKSGYFDAVVSFDFLEHLDNPSKALLEIARVLKKGGLYHSLTPVENSLATVHGVLLKFGYFPKRKYADHVQQYTVSSLRNLMERAGFKFIKVNYSEHYLYQLVDTIYFSLLSLLRKNVGNTIEGYIKETQAKNHFVRLFEVTKNVVATLFYLESSMLKNFPGHGAHITLVKSA